MARKETCRTRAIVGAALAAWCGLGLAPTNVAACAAAATAEAPRARAVRALDALPMRFEEAGGGKTDVRFVARGAGCTLGFVPGGVDLTLGGASAAPALVRMRFAGASSAAPAGEAELPGRTNSIRGTDPSAWRLGVKGYARVRYAGVYPGVDAVCYGAGRELEYDFVVAPGADPAAIRLAFSGADGVSVDADGALVVRTSAGEVRQRPAVAYQETAHGRTTVACRYALRGGEARFELGAYDRSRPLVVDPVLDYATYFGGSGFDELRAMTVDPDGNICLVGDTRSADFPIRNGQAPENLQADIFVAKLSPSGRELLYSTTIGSSSFDTGFAVASDANGNLFVAGKAKADDFPLLRPLQLSGGDAVLLKLDATGAPLFSTWFGGNRNDGAYAVAADPAGNLVVVGDTSSSNFPTRDPIQAQNGGGGDAFVSRIRGDGQEILFSTYLGGSAGDTAYAVAVDGKGAAYVTGITGSAQFPTTAGAFQPSGPACDGSGGACDDAFVVKLDASNALVYATYLGGGSHDVAFGIAVDDAGCAYVVGQTGSPDFPTKGPIQAERRGVQPDGFVTKLDADGAALVYSTYLGGAGFSDSVDRVAVDAAGRAYVVGNAFSTDFPTVNSLQGYVGPDDVPGGVLAVLDPTGSRLLFATFYGGSDAAGMTGVALARGGGVYVAGTTGSSDLVLADPLFAYPGDTDSTPNGFLARFDDVLGGVVPPKVTDVRARRKTGRMSRVLIDGANFQPDMQVFVGADTTPWPSVKVSDSTSVVLRDTADLLRALPPGSRTRVRCVNPDGGEFTAYVMLE